MLRQNLGGFKVENVPGSHQKERNGKNKNGNTQICSCEGEGKKKKKKSKDKDKQWCHSTGKKSQEENSKKYGDGENCWEGI